MWCNNFFNKPQYRKVTIFQIIHHENQCLMAWHQRGIWFYTVFRMLCGSQFSRVNGRLTAASGELRINSQPDTRVWRGGPAMKLWMLKSPSDYRTALNISDPFLCLPHLSCKLPLSPSRSAFHCPYFTDRSHFFIYWYLQNFVAHSLACTQFKWSLNNIRISYVQ